jgi:hypothetical protein
VRSPGTPTEGHSLTLHAAKLAVIAAVVKVLAVAAIQVSAVPVCLKHADRKTKKTCLDPGEPGIEVYVTGFRLQRLVAFDAAFIVVLLLVQARQVKRSTGEHQGTDQISALVEFDAS